MSTTCPVRWTSTTANHPVGKHTTPVSVSCQESDSAPRAPGHRPRARWGVVAADSNSTVAPSKERVSIQYFVKSFTVFSLCPAWLYTSHVTPDLLCLASNAMTAGPFAMDRMNPSQSSCSPRADLRCSNTFSYSIQLGSKASVLLQEVAGLRFERSETSAENTGARETGHRGFCRALLE